MPRTGGGELVCGQEESGQGHTHTQECYPLERMDEPQCGQEETEDVVDEATGVVTVPGHHHTAQCWEKRVDRKLVCGQEESEDVVDEATGEVLVPGHHHSAECWLTGDELCYQYGCGQHESQGHTHSDSCYAWTPRLICQEEERPAGHVHTDECYEITQLFVCLEPEIVPHTHEASCYDENGVLVCQLPEVAAHQHTAECFTTPEGEAEPVRTLICGMEEHQHTEQCYVRVEKDEGPTYYCGLEEHIHTMPDCFFETGTLRCTLTEHVHDLTCLEPPVEVSEDPEQSQDPAESEEPEPSASQELEQTVVEGVELVDAQFPNVYSTDEFTMSFYVNGFAQVAEEHSQDQSQSQEQEPLRLPDPMPTQSGEEFMELVENMVPLAAMPRMMAYATPMSSGIEDVDPPAMGQTGSMTAPGSVPEPDGTAVDNSSQVILNDPALPEDHTEGGQQAPESLPASVEPTPETGLPSAEPTPEPTPEADTPSAQPERVLLDPSQVRFVVEPLEDEQSLNAAMTAAARVGSTGQASTLQMFTVTAYTGDGRKLDLADSQVIAELELSDEFLEHISSAGEEQVSTIDETWDASEEEAGEAVQAESSGTSIGVVDLSEAENEKNWSGSENPGSAEEWLETEKSVTTVAPAKMMRFQVNTASGDGKVALMLIRDLYPSFTVQYYANLQKPATTGGSRQLPFIDTSKAANNGEVLELKNGETNQTLMQLQLNEDGTVKFETSLEPVYKEKDNTFNPNVNDDLTVNDLFGMMENTHYKIKELWVLKEECSDPASTDPEDWTVYENWQDIRFTNNRTAAERDPQHVVLIQQKTDWKTVLRLVYDPEEYTVNNDTVDFFDYNITSDSKDKDGKAATINDGNGPYKVNSTKQGINAVNNYTGTGAHFAFGNTNTANGWDNGAKDANGQYWEDPGKNVNGLNKLNKSGRGKVEKDTYQGCTFGIVTGYHNGELEFSSGIAHQDLFSHRQISGKKVYQNSNLTFLGQGDTHTLTSAQVNGGTAVTGLEKFSHPQPSYTHINTNHFWPMDSVPYYEGKDLMFGQTKENSPTLVSGAVVKAQTDEAFPASDNCKNHNSYFGMHVTLSFNLDESYMGPLEYYFYGDDDLWVFLDGELVCDLGGVHLSVGEYVNLWDYLGEPNGERKKGDHFLDIFYLERGASGSTCWMQYTLPNPRMLPPSPSNPGTDPSLRLEKHVEGNRAEAYTEMEFQFKIELGNTKNSHQVVVYRDDNNTLESYVPMKLVNGVYVEDPDYELTEREDQVINYPLIEVSSGQPVTVALKDGWHARVLDLPRGAKYKITEVSTVKDCETTWTITRGLNGAGMDTGDRVLSEEGATVSFTNNFNYELPETGGAGTWYTMACVPLLAAGCLWYKKKSQGEEAADGS